MIPEKKPRNSLAGSLQYRPSQGSSVALITANSSRTGWLRTTFLSLRDLKSITRRGAQAVRRHRQISSHWIDGLAVFAVCLLVLTGVARIVSTYHVFNQTADEPASLAPGLEWLERGTYKIDPIHPPLARIAIALGPYLSGARMIHCNPQENVWQQGNEILFPR